MTALNRQAVYAFASLALLTVMAAAPARGGDCMSDRTLQYYERCYGPNGPYCISCDRCARAAQANCPDDSGCCLHRSCCCQKVVQFFSPGSCPPSRFWDICAYRVCFPMSPWYSNPRDGILYPAYGSRSPGCVPHREW